MYAGPTVLEVFNTLLRQLRLSVDYELTGSYDGSTNIGTKIIKAHEERQLQEAVIRTIGESLDSVWVCVCVCVGEASQDRLMDWISLLCLCLSHLCLNSRLCAHVLCRPVLISFFSLFFYPLLQILLSSIWCSFLCPLSFCLFQVHLLTLSQHTRDRRSCSSSWARSLSLGFT